MSRIVQFTSNERGVAWLTGYYLPPCRITIPPTALLVPYAAAVRYLPALPSLAGVESTLTKPTATYSALEEFMYGMR